jgi:hypothetical protein
MFDLQTEVGLVVAVLELVGVVTFIRCFRRANQEQPVYATRRPSAVRKIR